MESKQIGPGGYAGLALSILATCAAPLDFAVMSFFLAGREEELAAGRGMKGLGGQKVCRGVADAATSGLAYPLPGHLCMRIPGRATPVRVGRIRRMR
jgi:hypothetical protein